MRPLTRAAIFFAGTVGFMSVGAAIAPPWADAHTAPVTIESGGCRADGAWTATYTITPDFLSNNPDATINVPGSAYHWKGPWPYTHEVTVEAVVDSYTIRVTVAWDDGITFDSGAMTTSKPDNCPPVLTTATTTTCDRAIPPRDDCGGVPSTTSPTTAPVATAVPVTTTTPTADATSSTVPAPDSSEPTASPTLGPARSAPPTTASVGTLHNLPATGAGDVVALIGIALGGIFIGLCIVLVGTRTRGPKGS